MAADDETIAPRGIDVHTPHIARIYDYWLGGKDNFAVDRAAAEQVIAATPTVKPGVTANRAFLSRAVRFMVGEGVTQFLDIGTGIPTADNTHLIAQAASPESRVVYVDNDPIVLTHARALLSGVTAPTSFIDADLRDTGRILEGAAELLDFTRPIGLLLIAILHCVPDEEEPGALVRTLMGALAPGSFLAVTHPGIDQLPDQMAAAEKALTDAMGYRVTFRTREGVGRFFTGLDLLEPGVVAVQEWRPESPPAPIKTGMWGGVARKP
ncbi:MULTISPECIES: SAM-dependent methyltransferase [Actinomadura]|uniref:SAM-dependent methyltransferase n=1 Tax=Actinomadura litoris TaxID=2678616 RepID=A0A7K1KSF9_9ACTN|nr:MULTISPECIES: SAM-dependent methyltransferase [Actinomadura]MBT2208055.1 SAM-dependent methyltransferase [Actinomadura sp. NEAU-AAG7]MUN35102.1 SAM-dependent methyltransferase [Actinomadura litoris]